MLVNYTNTAAASDVLATYDSYFFDITGLQKNKSKQGAIDHMW